MLYVFDNRLPFDYSKKEMAIAKHMGNGILYDIVLETFTDFSGNKVDINGKLLFPRTGYTQIYKMNNAILKNGGKLRVSSEEINKLTEWPKYYKTKRKMKIYLGSDLINSEVINEIENEFGKTIFIKTVKKNFSCIIPITLLKDKDCVFYKTLLYHPEEKFAISEPVKILKDEYGQKEYRCFVINNEPYNISRFTTDVFHQIDAYVLEELQKIISSMKGVFPCDYVVDLMEYESNQTKQIDVVEFNPMHSSGLFLYNSALEKSEDILHTKNIREISKEFIANIESCSIKGQIPSVKSCLLYDVKNGFSSDLRSIYLVGEPGIIFAENRELTVESFAKKATQPQWIPFESDEGLLTGSESEVDVFDNFSKDLEVDKKETILNKLLKKLK